jgi:hypothetical protein
MNAGQMEFDKKEMLLRGLWYDLAGYFIHPRRSIMENKITIIEGPPPTFEAVQDGWALGLSESPTLADIAVTRLRTFNGPGLVERCHRSWRNQERIFLEFRTFEGLKHETPIVAARYIDMERDQLLVLWVRLENEDVELELDFEDDENDGDDTDLPDTLF